MKTICLGAALLASLLAGCMGQRCEQCISESFLSYQGYATANADSIGPADLGVAMEVKGDFKPAWALKKLDQPFTRRMVMSGKMRSDVADVPENINAAVGHVVRNAFLAFGDQPVEERLVKTGVWIGGSKYAIFEGPWRPNLPATFASYDPNKTFDVRVEVDLASHLATAVIDGQKFAQPIPEDMKAIHYYGYWVLNTRSHFSPLTIEGE